MPFSIFKTLFVEAKWLKLISVFQKINNKFSNSKWIFKCCRNYTAVETIYSNMLEMVINTRCFLWNILEGQDIEEHPACFKHMPSMGRLDYLVTDFQFLLDLVIKSLDSRVVYDHMKYNVLFELAHSLYTLLNSFCICYISRIYNEK